MLTFFLIAAGVVALAVGSGLYLKMVKNWHEAGEMERIHGGFGGVLDE